MNRLLLIFGLLRPGSRRIQYWMQTKNTACLRLVLRRGLIRERRTVIRLLRAYPTLAGALLPELLLQLEHHSIELARDTADFLQTVYASYSAPDGVIEGLLAFAERLRREQARLDSLHWYRSKMYWNGLIDKGKMKQLERVRQQLKTPIGRIC